MILQWLQNLLVLQIQLRSMAQACAMDMSVIHLVRTVKLVCVITDYEVPKNLKKLMVRMHGIPHFKEVAGKLKAAVKNIQ